MITVNEITTSSDLKQVVDEIDCASYQSSFPDEVNQVTGYTYEIKNGE